MDSKERQVARHIRGARHIVSRDEARRRTEYARQRKQTQNRRKPRQNDWGHGDEDEDEVADGDLFESMRTTTSTPAGRGGSGALAAPGHGPGKPAVLIAAYGARVRILLDGSERDAQVARNLAGAQLVVGDEVFVKSPHPGVQQVVGLAARRTLLQRRDPGRPEQMRAIAANVDVGVVVLAAGPDRLRTGILDRMWVSLACSEIRTVLAINKVDRCLDPDSQEDLERTLCAYRALGIACHAVSATEGHGMHELGSEIADQVTVLIGQSGVGKSSLANALDPGGERSVGEVRRDGKGRHTTSASTLRRLGGDTLLIDTPGVRSFGLGEVMREDVIRAFPDLAQLAQECAFADCRHTSEPRCAVRDAAGRDPALARRLDAWRRIRDSLGVP